MVQPLRARQLCTTALSRGGFFHKLQRASSRRRGSAGARPAEMRADADGVSSLTGTGRSDAAGADLAG